MSENGYYDGIHNETANFLAMPTKLIVSEKYEKVTDIAKVLYSLLRTVIYMNVKDGTAKRDEKGVFVSFSRKGMAEYMKRSESQIERAFHCLERYKLIDIERQKSGRPSKIRVHYLD